MQEKFEGEEERSAIEIAEESAKRDWQRKAHNCATTGNKHSLIPITWTITPKSKHVEMLLCTQCFHHISVSEAFKHRHGA